MQPIGLTSKDVRTNIRTGRAAGELMIVHLCLNCGRISCNRIAGDDNAHTILRLLDDSVHIDGEIIDRLNRQGISLLSLDDRPEVLTALYGYACGEYSG